LDLRRTWINAIVPDGSTMSAEDVQGHVYVGPTASWYGRVTNIANSGPGGVVGQTTRLHCDNASGGYCIGMKVAVRGKVPDAWGVWWAQWGVGPGMSFGHYVGCDQYGPCPQPLPYYTVIMEDVNVTQAVLRWNRSAGSTGDLIQILSPDGRGIIFRIDGEGRVHLPSGRVLE
jgi:hypothetical protein